MDLKKIILDQMSSNKYQALSLQGWADQLDMNESSAFLMLTKTLNNMENDFLVVRSSKDNYLLASSVGFVRGILTVNRKGFGFVDLEDADSIYIHERNLNGALNKDEVIARQQSNRDGSMEGEIVKVLNHATTTLIATIHMNRHGLLVELDDDRIKNTFKITNLAEYKLVDGQKVKLLIKKYGETLSGVIVEILGHVNDPGMDVLSVLLQYEIEPEFPLEVLKEAQAIEQIVTSEQKEGRTDLTGRTIVTIDGVDAKDLDDAISLEKLKDGYRLGVHIADVSYYVTENSKIDIEAYNRGTSVYVTDRVVPMLPHILSNGICSLNPHVERLTLSCDMEFDNKGEIINYQIYPSFIKTTERMTYTDVNKILEQDPVLCKKYGHLDNLFLDMLALSKIIRIKREKAGAIDFEKSEAKIHVDSRGKVLDIDLRERGESEKIIEDFMVSANECVARHTKWLENPSLYRVHEAPLAKKLREFAKMTLIMGHRFKGSVENVRPLTLQSLLLEFKDTDAYPVVSTMLLRSMQKARYDASCIGHFGLALSEYTHFTSPIRRYPDLIVHRMLRKYTFEHHANPDEIANDDIKMEEIAIATSLRERAATDAERDVEDMKKAEYMEDKIDDVFDGVISSVTKFGFFVELENTVEGLVHIQSLSDDYYEYDPQSYSLIGKRVAKVYKLGMKVRIKVKDADAAKRTIDFILVKDRKKKKQQWI